MHSKSRFIYSTVTAASINCRQVGKVLL
jgi:hypothetical protein